MAKFCSISLQFFNAQTFYWNHEHCLISWTLVFKIWDIFWISIHCFTKSQTIFDSTNILWFIKLFISKLSFKKIRTFLNSLIIYDVYWEYSNFCQENNSRKSCTCTHLRTVFFFCSCYTSPCMCSDCVFLYEGNQVLLPLIKESVQYIKIQYRKR